MRVLGGEGGATSAERPTGKEGREMLLVGREAAAAYLAMRTLPHEICASSRVCELSFLLYT